MRARHNLCLHVKKVYANTCTWFKLGGADRLDDVERADQVQQPLVQQLPQQRAL